MNAKIDAQKDSLSMPQGSQKVGEKGIHKLRQKSKGSQNYAKFDAKVDAKAKPNLSQIHQILHLGHSRWAFGPKSVPGLVQESGYRRSLPPFW